MPADSERIETGLSRRQVLARGAVAAGVVWAAPVIRTATAYATSAAGTERPCTNFFVVCIDPLGTRPVRFPPGQHGYDDISPAAAASVSTTTTSSTSTTSTTSTSTTTTTQPHTAAASHTTHPAPTTTTTTAPPGLNRGSIDESASNPLPLPPTTVPQSTPSPAPSPSPSPAPGASPAGSPPIDGFGLFPDPTAAALPPIPGAPVDPHALALAAAQGAAIAATPDNLPPGIKAWLDQNPDVPIRYPDILPMLTQQGDDAWAVTLPQVGGPDPQTHQCRMVKGWAQCRGKYAEFFVDPNPDSPDVAGLRLIFPNPRVDDLATDPTALIENIIFVYCCP